MQRITTATHELLIFTDGGQTHIYRWPLGQSPLPLAGALGPQTAGHGTRNWSGSMTNSDRDIRDDCEPHFQRLAGLFPEAVWMRGDPALLEAACDEVERLRGRIKELEWDL